MSTLKISHAHYGPEANEPATLYVVVDILKVVKERVKKKKSKGASESTFEGRAAALKPNTHKWDFTSTDDLEARHASERLSDLLVIDMYTSTRFTR